ncbi:MAG: hypothetical protein L0K89_06725, partial [Bifidobacterium crudilactis]|nr:hypothetical protein [Bifidobacterium crudilactis]
AAFDYLLAKGIKVRRGSDFIVGRDSHGRHGSEAVPEHIRITIAGIKAEQIAQTAPLLQEAAEQ